MTLKAEKENLYGRKGRVDGQGTYGDGAANCPD